MAFILNEHGILWASDVQKTVVFYEVMGKFNSFFNVTRDAIREVKIQY
jgi:hypothetical protein